MKIKTPFLLVATLVIASSLTVAGDPIKKNSTDTLIHATGNPIITHKFTADPAAMVYKGQVFIYRS
jgi:hypothetical protein